VGGVNWEPHRLGCLQLRRRGHWFLHKHKPARRCTLFPSESFRLRCLLPPSLRRQE
jgi:hypothetical protein